MMRRREAVLSTQQLEIVSLFWPVQAADAQGPQPDVEVLAY